MSEQPDSREAELIAMIRAIDVPAPERLHRSTEEQIAAASRGRGRGSVLSAAPRVAVLGGLAAAAVAVVLVLVIGSGGGSSSFDLRTATALAFAPPTQPAPAENASRREQLMASVEGIAFPYWEERFGWRSSGAREDRVAGRSVRTVFYSDHAGRRVGYSIVAGTPAPGVPGGSVSYRAGTPYRLRQMDGSTVVTWLRHGHLCIVAGRGVPAATLLALASWHEHASAA